ncbi:MAG: ornithine cyclodeaminase family protein [Rhodovibrionaceae bacterium]
MRMISADEVRSALDFPSLVEALRAIFREGAASPVRHHHDIEKTGEPNGTLLLMPAWSEAYIGVKVVAVTPGNAERGLPAVQGTYMLLDGTTGELAALVDGPMLTVRRTAAASALAADYLARKDAQHLVMVGTGALAPHLIEAHAAVRPIEKVTIWGRHPEKAEALAEALNGQEVLSVNFSTDLEAAVAEADVISCATLSTEPLILGDWLKPGQHLDLVGAFRPDMRETDDACMRAARVFVDTRAGATKEAGDIVQAIDSGALTPEAIAADFFELTQDKTQGRGSDTEITLFKSVGSALEDLAGATLAVERA